MDLQAEWNPKTNTRVLFTTYRDKEINIFIYKLFNEIAIISNNNKNKFHQDAVIRMSYQMITFDF